MWSAGGFAQAASSPPPLLLPVPPSFDEPLLLPLLLAAPLLLPAPLLLVPPLLLAPPPLLLLPASSPEVELLLLHAWIVAPASERNSVPPTKAIL
jgi:hypothetical protein